MRMPTRSLRNTWMTVPWEHYAGRSKPKLIVLYHQLPTLKKKEFESATEFIIRVKSAAIALKAVNKNMRDVLLVAMVLKGLLEEFKPLIVNVTQSEEP